VTWGHYYMELACGCAGNVTAGSFHDVAVGDYQQCRKHGDTEVRSLSAVYESSGSRDVQLGIREEGAGDGTGE